MAVDPIENDWIEFLTQFKKKSIPPIVPFAWADKPAK